MATGGDLTVKIKADARHFDRTMRRIQFDLWVMRWGWQIAAIAGGSIFGFGLLLGIVAS